MCSEGMGDHQRGIFKRSWISRGNKLCYTRGLDLQSVSSGPSTGAPADLLSDVWHVVRALIWAHVSLCSTTIVFSLFVILTQGMATAGCA